MAYRSILTALTGAGLATGLAHAQPLTRPVPYWASIAAGEARMRTGPGRNYPTSWVYRRAGLPVEVVQVYPGWRKVRDPDGTTGWMIANLLSAQRTAIVAASGADLLVSPDPGAHAAFHAQGGVVGRISQCAVGWCRLDVGGRGGFVEADRLWGVAPGETLE